jgi:adhesin transport system outer membrane protein
VVNRYLTVLMHEKLYHLAIENYNRHRRITSMINDLSKSGLSRASDVDQSNGRIAQADANRISAQSNLREAKINYAKIVGKWPHKLVWPKIPARHQLPATLTRALEIGVSSHPFVKSAYANVREAKAQYEVARATKYPKVDLILSASNNRNLDGLVGPNNDRLAMVRVNYNLFHGGSDQAHIRETAFQVQEAYEEKNGALIDLNESIRLAWNVLESARLRLSPLEKHVSSAKLTRGAYQEQFKINKRTLLDLLDSENELYQAQNDYTRGQMDEIFARYRILNGMGKLLPYLHMQLPVNVKNDSDVFRSDDGHILLNTHNTQQASYPDYAVRYLPVVRTDSTFKEEKPVPVPATVVNNKSAYPAQGPLKTSYTSTDSCKTKADAFQFLLKDTTTVKTILDTCQ